MVAVDLDIPAVMREADMRQSAQYGADAEEALLDEDLAQP